MSSIARQRSDSSPQKLKAVTQQSFSGAAEAESKLEEERKRKEASAAKKREERKRLDELQRLKDEEDAEEAARRIVDSSSRIARMRLEEHQRQEHSLRQQQAEETPLFGVSPPPPAAADPPREQSFIPARAGASSPVKKYLRNELRFVCAAGMLLFVLEILWPFSLLDTLSHLCLLFTQCCCAEKQELAQRRCWQFRTSQRQRRCPFVRRQRRGGRRPFFVKVALSQFPIC
jgi:hypothetical protein